MKLRKKGKTTNSEWFGVEHYHILHEMDLFRHVNMERFLFPCLEFHVSGGNRISLNRQFFLKSLFFNIKA